MKNSESWDIAAIEARIQFLDEEWAIAHAKRLLKLIDQICDGHTYNSQAVQWAAYLHDWGAIRPSNIRNCDHAARSGQVAASEILIKAKLPGDTHALILQSKKRQDYRDNRPVRSIEARLLREADCLDFLGAIAIYCEIARGSKDLPASYARIDNRKDPIKDHVTLSKVKIIAEEHLA